MTMQFPSSPFLGLFAVVVIRGGFEGARAQSLHARLMEARENPCKLYLAPSHLTQEDSVKYGLFAGIDYDANETLPFSEMAIPFVDFIQGPYHTDENSDIMKYLEAAFWTADYAGARFEGNHSTTLLVPGIGSLAHYHSGIHNIEWVQASALLRDSNSQEDEDDGNTRVTERGKFHPSRGAITPYTNLTVKATVKIPAGMELFANFGDVWDDSKHVDPFEQTIQRWDYYDADKVLDKMLEFLNKYSDRLDADLSQDVVDLILDRVLGTAGGKRAKAIKSLIPANPRKLQQVKDAGGTFNYRNQDMVKSRSWLKKNGICVDSLRSGKSTVPDAGRGAFATRDFKSGDRIAVSPMLLIANDDLVSLFRPFLWYLSIFFLHSSQRKNICHEIIR